jgi:putative transposase
MQKHTPILAENKTIVSPVADVLTELLRQGAQRLLASAVEAEVSALLQAYAGAQTEEGKPRLIRNGYLPRREVLTGVGAVPVQVPRVRDRAPNGGAAIRFHSALLPPYLRRSRSVAAVLPWLYLRGLSTGDFQSALSALLGEQAVGLSAGSISRFKEVWESEYEAWSRRDLSDRQYVYWWVDGIHCQARMDEKQCLLVIMGATATGQKELIAVEGGFRESEESWRGLLEGLRRRGLRTDPVVAVGDGALGFWNALACVYPTTKVQRCWFHKMGNVLVKLPKSVQTQATRQLQDIWQAPARKAAEDACDVFAKTWAAKYPKAVECLLKNRAELLTFYDFPEQHWKHLRTTNPIESTFATVRLRTYKSRNCVSHKTALAMVYRLCLEAQKSWRKLDGAERLPEVLNGTRFVDGAHPLQRAA